MDNNLVRQTDSGAAPDLNPFITFCFDIVWQYLPNDKQCSFYSVPQQYNRDFDEDVTVNSHCLVERAKLPTDHDDDMSHCVSREDANKTLQTCKWVGRFRLSQQRLNTAGGEPEWRMAFRLKKLLIGKYSGKTSRVFVVHLISRGWHITGSA